jgi:hypothetical protein
MDNQHAQTSKPAAEPADAAPQQAAARKPTDPQVPLPLTPEEQMALYEKELKEDDWGHQPC